MSKASGLLIFTMGAAIGSAVTWYYVKEKYRKLAQEEIDSVKEVFGRRQNSVDTERTSEEHENEPEHRDYIVTENAFKEALHDLGYGDPTPDDMDTNCVIQYKQKKEIKDEIERPVVIPPDEFGDYPDYEKITLYCYMDKVLVDEDNEIIDDVEGVVGSEALDSFGEYEDDAVHVRNDRREVYYEILLDYRKYTDTLMPNSRYVEE